MSTLEDYLPGRCFDDAVISVPCPKCTEQPWIICDVCGGSGKIRYEFDDCEVIYDTQAR